MKLKVGNIWDELGQVELLLVTTCNTLKSNGELVMGAGIAKQAALKYHDLALFLGGNLKEIQPKLTIDHYGLMLGYDRTGTKTELGAFQTKDNWKDNSSLEIIDYSCFCLARVAPYYKTIALNCPGIGYGQLTYDAVLPYIQGLPDNVTIYVQAEKEVR